MPSLVPCPADSRPAPSRKRWFSPIARRNSSDAAILARDRYRCGYCSCELTESGDTRATIDHIIPQSAFGSHAAANQDVNRIACCWRCNQDKGGWLPSTPTHRAWYDRTYCISFIVARLRQCRGRKGSCF
jgi:5-methylcytosine-specific restriction endonuclease McrA